MSTELNCKFNEEGSQLPDHLNVPITVGKEMVLSCEGTLPNFDVAKLKAEALNQAEHTLRLLKYEVQEGKALVTLTSYRVGEHQNVEILLTDGTQNLRTNPVSWQVQSVIDPNNPEAGKPFGPFGPWTISWPWWYFLVLALLLALIIGIAVKAWRASKRKLEVRRRINEYRQKFNPFDQYQKTLRKLDRDYHQALVKSTPTTALFQELQTASLTYLMMEFELDVEGRSPRWVVKRLKRQGPKAKDASLNDLFLFLSEFQKTGQGQVSDFERMVEWAGRISEKVDRQSFGIKK